jgi:hypothetical protein
MALTDAEKTAIRRHLGLNAASPALYPFVPTFHAVTNVLDTLPEATETEARAILERLAVIEGELGDAITLLAVSRDGSIAINPDHTRQLRAERHQWRRELSTLLGVPLAHNGTQITVT